MKTLKVAVTLLLMISMLQVACMAEDNTSFTNCTIRDKYGNVTGNIYSTSKTKSVETDKWGNVVKTYNKVGNEIQIYDKYGNYTGSYRK